MKAFAIFEGGGAKGLAHVGALAAAEQRHLVFEAVAGASAGSIVAALISAGYKANELFDIRSPERNKVFDRDFLSLLDNDLWSRTKPLLDEVRSILDGSKKFAKRNIPGFLYRHWWFFRKIIADQGIFDTEACQIWVEQLLRKRVKPTPGDPFVRFKDMPIPLTIVATDLFSKKIKIFSKATTPNFPVSRAVAASISIPFVFKPVILDGMVLVDGGVLSNFPAWVFDESRRRSREIIPTVGFKLVTPPDSEPMEISSAGGFGLMRFMEWMFATIFSGDSLLETREIDDLNLLPISVSCSSLDFDLDYKRKKSVFLEGKDSAEHFFRGYIGPKDPDEIRAILDVEKDALKKLFGKPIHLRMNVSMPIAPNNNRLRILYTHNMSRDADDRLIFEMEEGAIGRCWTDREILSVDLDKAKKTFATEWKMSKYQQALIRASLKSLICVPVFDPNDFDFTKAWKDNPILGVLSVDSDSDELFVRSVAGDEFSSKIRQVLINASSRVANRIIGV